MHSSNFAAGPRVSALAGWFVGFALAAMALPASSQTLERIDTVDKWDHTLDSVRVIASGIRSATDKGPKDIRGRVAEDDWKQWILTPETEAQLATLRQKVGVQATLSDYSGVSQTVREAVPLVEGEAYKSRLLSTYWLLQDALVHHRRLMEPLLALIPKDQAKAISARMKATEKRIADSLAPAIAANPATAGPQELQKLRHARAEATEDYNKQRAELVAQLAPRAKGTPRSRTRQAACTMPSTATSGADKPKLAPSNASLDEVYPQDAVRDDVEGRVVLRVSVAPTGCMERAEVSTSSGADELDDAALLYADRSSYLPAEKDGKASSGSFLFAVQFKLPD